MSKLTFDAKDVKRVVEHSIAATGQGKMIVGIDGPNVRYGLPEQPAVLLVHDDGVYLMSNGQPRDFVSGDDGKGGGRSFCAYAKGCHPDDPGSWDTSRALVGGDDFGETLPWAREIKELIDARAKRIVIEISADRIELVK
jgi:hypothetical protein